MKHNKIKKLVLTGGHAGATAYAFIQEIKRKDADIRQYDTY